MNILVHDYDDIQKDFFSAYKNLEIVNISELKNIKQDKEEEYVFYDATINNMFYEKFKSKYNLKEFPYLFDTVFVKQDNKKVIKMNDIRDFIFYKDKHHFDSEKLNEFKKGHDVISGVLDKTLDKFQNVFEEELEKIPNLLNINDISNGDDKIWFVKDLTKQIVPEGKIIDAKSLLLLLELKNILTHEVV